MAVRAVVTQLRAALGNLDAGASISTSLLTVAAGFLEASEDVEGFNDDLESLAADMQSIAEQILVFWSRQPQGVVNRSFEADLQKLVHAFTRASTSVGKLRQRTFWTKWLAVPVHRKRIKQLRAEVQRAKELFLASRIAAIGVQVNDIGVQINTLAIAETPASWPTLPTLPLGPPVVSCVDDGNRFNEVSPDSEAVYTAQVPILSPAPTPILPSTRDFSRATQFNSHRRDPSQSGGKRECQSLYPPCPYPPLQTPISRPVTPKIIPSRPRSPPNTRSPPIYPEQGRNYRCDPPYPHPAHAPRAPAKGALDSSYPPCPYPALQTPISRPPTPKLPRSRPGTPPNSPSRLTSQDPGLNRGRTRRKRPRSPSRSRSRSPPRILEPSRPGTPDELFSRQLLEVPVSNLVATMSGLNKVRDGNHRSDDDASLVSGNILGLDFVASTLPANGKSPQGSTLQAMKRSARANSHQADEWIRQTYELDHINNMHLGYEELGRRSRARHRAMRDALKE